MRHRAGEAVVFLRSDGLILGVYYGSYGNLGEQEAENVGYFLFQTCPSSLSPNFQSINLLHFLISTLYCELMLGVVETKD